MARNIEIKARARDPHGLRERAAALAGGPPQVLEQVDTFFHAATGRLKLRELGPGHGELIWYERANDEGPKESTYFIAPAPDPDALKRALAGAHGVRGVVAKRRELFLVGQTRIHVDEVAGLGHFVELEYVLGDDEATADGETAVAGLMEALGIDRDDLIARAYVDLLPCIPPVDAGDQMAEGGRMDKNLVFVYGTLRQGGVREMRTLFPDCSFVSEATLRGVLYDLGAYPGLALVESGDVKGEVYEVSDEMLKELDGIEGFDASDPTASPYVRKQVGDYWVYVFNPAKYRPATQISSGDWIEHARSKTDWPDETRTIVHEWFERVWNSGETDAIDELLAEDARVHGLKSADGSDVGGRAEFRVMHQAFRDAFPDIRIDVDECMVDGERMAFRCRVQGTHAGGGLGIAATGNPVDFTGMGFVRVRDGKIVEAWNTFDFQTMNAQVRT